MRRSFFALFAFFCTAASAASPALANSLRHTVVPGDTLWSIAATYRVSVGQLEARNHLTDQSILQLGQTIEIAGSGAAPATARIAHAHSHHKNVVAHVQHARVIARARHAESRRPMPIATANAVWVATHSGDVPSPAASAGYALARRVVAFDERVTRTALRYIGVPYVWGGTSFDGVDCSGFVQAVFEHNGIELPRTADSQFEEGRPVRAAQLQPGDLVFFETYEPGASHVGIYIGGGRFIHASSSEGVRIDALGEDYYAERYIGARRLIR